MKKRTAWIIAGGVATVAMGAAAVGAMALLLRYGSPSWGGQAYVYVGLQGDIPENPSPELGALFERRQLPLRSLIRGLDQAAQDPDVTGLMLRVGPLATGWARVQEIRAAVARFRRSGKPAYAHVEFCGNKEYYLATACSEIYAVPTAILDVSGLSAEVMFLRKTLDKLGVEAQFEAVGRFKTAPNQLTESGLTGPHREQLDALLDSLHAEYVSAIAEAREKTTIEAQAIIDEGPYDAKRALEAGLVDELLYRDELEEKLEDGRRVSITHYARSTDGFRLTGRSRLALVYAVGDIVPGESQDGPFGGSGYAGSDTISGALRRARRDDSIEAIILRIDSPGGSGTASDVIWREVSRAREAKPVIVSMGDLAASGGYYIAMAGDAIVAQPGTLTGSIGVFGGKFNLRGLYDKIGVTKEILARGKHAAMFTDYRPWDQSERTKFRELQQAFYEDFVEKAAQGREKTYAEMDSVAQGRVWTGQDALRVGLVDELGGLDTAIRLAKEKAGLGADEEVALVVLPEPKGLLETLLDRSPDGLVARLPREIRVALRWARLLALPETLARLPYDLAIN